MRLRPEQLDKHLQGQLLPVYLVSGDEPLIQMEVCDRIRRTAAAAGYTQREVYAVPQNSAQFDWNRIRQESSALSLFAQQRILEIRLTATTRLGDGAKVFEEYAAQPPTDTLLLVTAPKLDRSAQNTRWVKALEGAGAWIQVWPVDAHQLPRWIEQRLRRQGVRATEGATRLLADRVEGNLLAAAQEVDKLSLLVEPGRELDEATIATVVADSARYSVFTLTDRMLAGQVDEAVRTLRGLREEGTEPIVVLWAFSRELRTLARAAELRAQGASADHALKSVGVWESRKALLQQALKRLKPSDLAVLLRLCATADRTIKGLLVGDAWEHLTAICLMASGVRHLNRNSLAVGLQDG